MQSVQAPRPPACAHCAAAHGGDSRQRIGGPARSCRNLNRVLSETSIKPPAPIVSRSLHRHGEYRVQRYRKQCTGWRGGRSHPGGLPATAGMASAQRGWKWQPRRRGGRRRQITRQADDLRPRNPHRWRRRPRAGTAYTDAAGIPGSPPPDLPRRCDRGTSPRSDRRDRRRPTGCA